MKKTGKHLYRILFGIRLLLSVHIGYQYIKYSSFVSVDGEKKGTIVEATINEVGYLPYITTSDEDKFYQSLLYRSCIFPVLNETEIQYEDDLCQIETTDYQTFTVRLSDTTQWSDDTQISLNDILFTYKTVLSENYWEIPSLDTYKSITVLPDVADNSLKVSFGQASVDNMIFFTNFILPSHILANQPLSTYGESYALRPVTSACATLQPSQNDITSTVFDLSNCEEVGVKYYQVKAFSSVTDILEYIPTGSTTIDMSFEDFESDGYTTVPYLSNKFLTFFFNTQSPSVGTPKRKLLGSLLTSIFNTTDTQDYLIKDQYLFDHYDTVALGNTGMIATLRNDLMSTPTQEREVIPTIVSTLNRSSDTSTATYHVTQTIEDKYQMTFTFEDDFERLSVTRQGGSEYFPASYSPLNKSSFYNLNPLFKNVAEGENIYTIRGYTDGQVVAQYTLTIRYLELPQEATTPTATPFQPIRILSFGDEVSTKAISDLQAGVAEYGLEDLFVFETIDQRSAYEGKLTGRDYDLVLRTINAGLRKDISGLFTQDDPLINPSLRNDEEYVTQMSRYFHATPEEQASIQTFLTERFKDIYPLVMIGKGVETLTLRDEIDNPFPFRVYTIGWRKPYLKNLITFEHITIDRDRAKSVDNILAFFTDGLGIEY